MAMVEDNALEMLPLWPDQDEETIGERWAAWANEGLTLDDPRWVDTRPGSFWYIATRPGVREAARLYDLAGTEMVASTMVLWSWGEFLDDIGEGYGVFRLAATPAQGEITITGTDGVGIEAGYTVATSPVDPAVEPQEYETTRFGVISGGFVTLPIEATIAGTAGNVSGGEITVPQSQVGGVASIMNDDRTVGGTDPETDEAFRERLLEVSGGQGPGSQRDYVRWARDFDGVGDAIVIPLWDGPGTVLIILITAEGQPVTDSVVEDFQEFIDPIPGTGAGRAPVGPTVTVATATSIDVTVLATVECEPGYSLDGAGGTIAVRAAIDRAVRAHVETAPPGGEINVRKIIAAIINVSGVNDTKDVSVDAIPANLPNGNIALTSNPALVASLDALTLTEGSV